MFFKESKSDAFEDFLIRWNHKITVWNVKNAYDEPQYAPWGTPKRQLRTNNSSTQCNISTTGTFTRDLQRNADGLGLFLSLPGLSGKPSYSQNHEVLCSPVYSDDLSRFVNWIFDALKMGLVFVTFVWILILKGRSSSKFIFLVNVSKVKCRFNHIVFKTNI